VSNLRSVLRVAYRHIDAPTTSPKEREEILGAMVTHLKNPEAELAAQTLHHMREQRRHQLTLRTILEGTDE